MKGNESKETSGRTGPSHAILYSWMYSPNSLALSGNELVVYVQLYDAAQHDRGFWTSTGRKLAAELGISHACVSRCVARLIDRGLVHEGSDDVDGRRRFIVDQDIADAAMRDEEIRCSEGMSQNETPISEQGMSQNETTEFSSIRCSEGMSQNETPISEQGMSQNETPTSTCDSSDNERIAFKDSALNAFKSECVKERNALGNPRSEEGSAKGKKARKRPSETKRDKGVRCESFQTEFVGSPTPSPEFDELVGHLLKQESPLYLQKCRALFDGLRREGWSARQIIDAYDDYAAWEQASDQGKDDTEHRHALWLSTWLKSDFGFRRFVKGAPKRAPKAERLASELVRMFARCSSAGDGWVTWLVDERGVRSGFEYVRCPASATEEEARRAWDAQSLAVA